MRTFFFHNEKVLPVELSGDKSTTIPRPDFPSETMKAVPCLRLEVGFPPTPINANKRCIKIGSANQKPVTVDFPPDESAVEFLVPKNESLRVEFTTHYHDERTETLSAEFFAEQKLNVPKEPSPLSFNLLGECETYLPKDTAPKPTPHEEKEKEKKLPPAFPAPAPAPAPAKPAPAPHK